MKALVTGGCGFIGSHLVDRLLAEGHEVVVIDNLATGRRQNLDQHRDSASLSMHFENIVDHERIAPLFEGVDLVFHLAALADIVPSIQRPMDYHRANVEGTISVLEAARNAKVGRFVYAASSSCYGIPDEYPTPESSPIRPEYPYAFTKYVGEEYCFHWQKVYDLPVTALRFFNVYGTRQRTTGTYGAVFGVFLAQKINGKPLTVVGDGTQTRDFTYVTDVVDACYTVARNEQVVGEVMNVGSGNTYSVNHLVELIGGEKTHIPKRPGEPDQTFADITRIRELTGWEPKVPFEEGVQEMLDNIDYWKNAPVWDEESISEATRDWFKYLGKEEKTP